MKKLADYLFFSSFFISACAFGLVWETCLLTGVLPDFRVAGLLFFATLFLYNFDGLVPYKTGQQTIISEKKKWLLQHRTFLIAVTILAGIFCVYFCLQLNYRLPGYFLAPLFLVSVLYSLPLT